MLSAVACATEESALKEKYEQAKASDENLAALEEKYLEMIG